MQINLSQYDLKPYGNKSVAVFREHGNIWMLDPAKTIMFDSRITSYNDCFNNLLIEQQFQEIESFLFYLIYHQILTK